MAVASASAFIPSGAAGNGGASDVEFAVAVTKVAAYFFTLFLCLYHVVRDMWPSTRRDVVPAKRNRLSRLRRVGGSILLVLFVVINFAFTWRMIVKFLEEDYAAYSRQVTLPLALRRRGSYFAEPPHQEDLGKDVAVGAPLRDWITYSDWFVAAYDEVKRTELQWLWSSSLLLLVCTISLFVYVESYRCGVRGGSNLWLGCVAAISVATPLFMCSMLMTTNETYFSRIVVPGRWWVGTAVAVALVCVMLVPFAQDELQFIVLLGVMHAAVAAPAVFVQVFRSAAPSDEAIIRFFRFLSATRPGPPAPIAGPPTAASRTAATGAKSPAPPVGKQLPSTSPITASNFPEAVLRASLLITDQTWVSRVYAGIACAAAVTLIHSVVRAIESGTMPRIGVAQALLSAAVANACQTSVSYDFVASAFTMLLFVWFDRATPRRWAVLCTILFLVSPVVAIPVYLSAREGYLIRRFEVALVKSLAATAISSGRKADAAASALARLQGAPSEASTTTQRSSTAAPARAVEPSPLSRVASSAALSSTLRDGDTTAASD